MGSILCLSMVVGVFRKVKTTGKFLKRGEGDFIVDRMKISSSKEYK